MNLYGMIVVIGIAGPIQLTNHICIMNSVNIPAKGTTTEKKSGPPTWVAALSVILALLLSGFGYAQDGSSKSKDGTDRVLSPYFFIPGDDSSTDQLPLKSTKANVTILESIAHVEVSQTYRNDGQTTLEAIYVFPGSTRSAVHSMEMKIGDRTIVANVKEKEKARQEYEQAKKAGNRASLLEQKRPNVFQMNVANIQPGEEIAVTLQYTEWLVPTEGLYEFVYPTVVGPRYTDASEEIASVAENWVANPFTASGTLPSYTLDMKAELRAGANLRDVRSSSHEVSVNFTGKTSANIALKGTEKHAGNRDFVLQYRLQDKKIASGIMLYEGKDENYFMMSLQPPDRVTPAEMPAREYVFIVDVSGSMNGFPLNISKELMKNLLSNMQKEDRFNIILFASSSRQLSASSLPATQENIEKAMYFINRERGGGGTSLLPALQKALALPTNDNYSRNFVIATDGYVTVEQQAFDLIRKNLGKANFFAFGIGSSVNRHIIEGIARVGKGEPFVLLNGNEAPKQANRFKKYIESPVLTNIKVDFQGFEAYDVSPAHVNDVFANRPVMIFGKYKGSATGRVNLSGKSGSQDYSETLQIASNQISDKNEALRYLWARKKIQDLDDYRLTGASTPAIKEEVTALGLKYNLLTAYTSFIAVDSEVIDNPGNSTTVKQPLPLPQGVSNYALGGAKTKKYSMNAPTSSNYAPMKVESLADEVELADDVDEKMEEPAMFIIVEQMPEFPGGQDALMKFLNENIQYPQLAKDAGIEGKVYLRFTVGKDGKVKNIQVLRGVSPEIDAEAIRVLKAMPAWEPGEQRGKKVEVQMTLPIHFNLNN